MVSVWMWSFSPAEDRGREEKPVWTVRSGTGWTAGYEVELWDEGEGGGGWEEDDCFTYRRKRENKVGLQEEMKLKEIIELKKKKKTRLQIQANYKCACSVSL